ncbi:hypothetical protein KKG72_04705 [bacterium]|nr:hypothetical protein [bacterium]
MQVNETKTYITSKKRFKNQAQLLTKIDKTIDALKNDTVTPNMNFKKINCKRDKTRHSIRVVGTKYRVLLSFENNISDLVCICDHDTYEQHNKNC